MLHLLRDLLYGAHRMLQYLELQMYSQFALNVLQILWLTDETCINN